MGTTFLWSTTESGRRHKGEEIPCKTCGEDVTGQHHVTMRRSNLPDQHFHEWCFPAELRELSINIKLEKYWGLRPL